MSTTRKIEFTVSYAITLNAEDYAKVEQMINEYKMAKACRYLMNEYNIGLFEANCIRKAIMGGEDEFICDLSA